MIQPSLRKKLAIIGGAIVTLTLVLVLVLNGRVTAWIEGPGFQDLLNRETSKGLKLTANYGSLQRVGLLGIHADSFSGMDGYKTIVSIQANDISGRFNPGAFGLSRWQVDAIHIKSGTVKLQKTEATPGAGKGAPWPPWWGLFWPYRVYLADVKVDDAKVLFNLNEKESGIYDTFLEVTPNGRDFEYDAHGGEFKTPMTPKLTVQHVHLLIRKPRLYCSEFTLGDDQARPDNQLRVTGDAGLQDDRSMKLKMDMTSLKVAPWLPEKLRAHVEGQMSGYFDYTSTGTGMETGKGSGKITIVDAVLRELAPVHQYVTVTGSPDPGPMKLKVCQADVKWDAGAITAENIEAECDGVFRLTGTITIAADKTLNGQVEFGLTDPYIKWLPTARSAVFTRDERPYHFTTIHFSGTSKKPVQDLTPRIEHEVAKSPLLALKLFFNQAGDWFDFD